MQSSLLKKLLLVFISLGLSVSGVQRAQAVSVVVNVPVPMDREMAGPPEGYQNCYVVPSGFYNGYFIHAHRVCEYADSPYGGAWVGGYWQCPFYRHGVCGGPWEWSPHHWVAVGGPEYGVIWHDGGGYYRGHAGPRYGHEYHHGGYYREGHHGHER